MPILSTTRLSAKIPNFCKATNEIFNAKDNSNRSSRGTTLNFLLNSLFVKDKLLQNCNNKINANVSRLLAATILTPNKIVLSEESCDILKPVCNT
uniref:Uncharacterized protein n=1 Tax=Strongyloides venezuelensis TaxID=75913 RepID=A0A0K0G5P5_STRVS